MPDVKQERNRTCLLTVDLIPSGCEVAHKVSLSGLLLGGVCCPAGWLSQSVVIQQSAVQGVHSLHMYDAGLSQGVVTQKQQTAHKVSIGGCLMGFADQPAGLVRM